jgi:hypothetical protein
VPHIVPGDGCCLYYALILLCYYQLKHPVADHHTLAVHLVQYLLSHRPQYNWAHPQNYLPNSPTFEYPGEAVVSAMAHSYNLTIHVHTPGRDHNLASAPWTTVLTQTYSPPHPHTLPSIHLWLVNEHYTPLLPASVRLPTRGPRCLTALDADPAPSPSRSRIPPPCTCSTEGHPLLCYPRCSSNTGPSPSFCSSSQFHRCGNCRTSHRPIPLYTLDSTHPTVHTYTSISNHMLISPYSESAFHPFSLTPTSVSPNCHLISIFDPQSRSYLVYLQATTSIPPDGALHLSPPTTSPMPLTPTTYSPFPPLTLAQITLADQTRHGHHVPHPAIWNVTPPDLLTLADSTWVNSSIIDGYLQRLTHSHNLSHPPSSTHAYAASTDAQLHCLFDCPTSQHLEVATRIHRDGFDPLSYSLLLIPIHHNPNHWALIAIDLIHTRISYHDSIHGMYDGEPYLAFYQHWLELVTLIYPHHHINASNFTLSQPPTPQQLGTTDCGIFTIMYAECLMRSLPLSHIQPPSVVYHRRRITSYLLTTPHPSQPLVSTAGKRQRQTHRDHAPGHYHQAHPYGILTIDLCPSLPDINISPQAPHTDPPPSPRHTSPRTNKRHRTTQVMPPPNNPISTTTAIPRKRKRDPSRPPKPPTQTNTLDSWLTAPPHPPHTPLTPTPLPPASPRLSERTRDYKKTFPP